LKVAFARRRGISLIEVVIILLVLGILAGGLAPTLLYRMRKTKLARAREDVCAIRDAIVNMLADVTPDGLLQDGSEAPAYWDYVMLAVGDGDIPELGPDGSAEWVQPVNFTTVDFLENHISTNRPGNDPANAYPNWQGAYIAAPIDPDPWGNRYMVNAINLSPGSAFDVVVISAGPDEEIDSQFYQDGFVPGDDDIICLLSAGGGGPCEITICNTCYYLLRIYVNGAQLGGDMYSGECTTETLSIGDNIVIEGQPTPGDPFEEADSFTLEPEHCGTTRSYCPPGGGGDQCDPGEKPIWIDMRYTGEDCTATNTTQTPDKWSCSGDPAYTSPVHIISSNKNDPTDPKALIWFDGIVNLDEVYRIDAANAGETILKNQTWIHIYDLSDNLLQTVTFHTSCSQPLIPGEQWGANYMIWPECIVP